MLDDNDCILSESFSLESDIPESIVTFENESCGNDGQIEICSNFQSESFVYEWVNLNTNILILNSIYFYRYNI